MAENDNLRTPSWVWRPLGPFDLDPCAGESTVIARHNVRDGVYIRGGMYNGLQQDWTRFGHTFFCNPPFSKKEEWIEKVVYTVSTSDMQGFLLLPERSSAPWFMKVIPYCSWVFYFGKKINFEGGPSSNNVGSILFIFGMEMRRRLIDSKLPGTLMFIERYTTREYAEKVRSGDVEA